MGGPVSFGKPYLVGEQGPELFVPGMSGRIEPNDTLRRLTSDGASAVASSSENTTTRGPVTIQNHWTIRPFDRGLNCRDLRRRSDLRFWAQGLTLQLRRVPDSL